MNLFYLFISVKSKFNYAYQQEFPYRLILLIEWILLFLNLLHLNKT